MSNLDKTPLITPQKKLIKVSANKADTLSKMRSNSPAPAATSSKPRSVSRSSRKDESFSQRVPMEEEPNTSSEQEGSQNRGHTKANLPTYMPIEMFKDLIKNENQDFVEEKEVKLDDNGEGLNNGAEQSHSGSTNPPTKAALLACLEKMTMADIRKNFFELQQCLPCQIKISKKFRDHIKNHINGKKNIKCDYSFDLHPDGQSLQVKCKKCKQTFTDLTAKKLEEHNQACKSVKIILNNRPSGSIIDNGSEELKECREKIKTLEDQLASFGTRLGKTEVKLAGVFKTQGTMKTKLDNTARRVTVVERNVTTLETRVEDHETGIVTLVNHFISLGHYEKLNSPVTSTDIFKSGRLVLKPKDQSKEEERDRDRSKDRDRSGSSERKNERQRSRDQRHDRERERSGERRHGRRDYSEDDNRRTTRSGNKGQQSYRGKNYSRRY